MTAQEAEQKRRYRVQYYGLGRDEQDGDYRVKDAMLCFEPVQPVAQKMQDQEEISSDKNCIDHQLNGKHAQAFGIIFFHEESVEG
jgi:hypothetical protein